MNQCAIEANGTPGEALRRWLELAGSHDVYIDLAYEFSGVVGELDSFPPQLTGPLDEWMRDLIQRCRDEEQAERWLRLKFIQREHTLQLECEAVGHPPDVQKLQNTGVHFEIADMGESFFMALETALTGSLKEDGIGGNGAMETTRIFRVDGDEVAVPFRYNEACGKYLGSYPDFVDEPRYTPNGRPWKSVVWDECPYAPQPDNDCGRCGFLRKENSGDLIGVCFHEALRQAPEAVCGDA